MLISNVYNVISIRNAIYERYFRIFGREKRVKDVQAGAEDIVGHLFTIYRH